MLSSLNFHCFCVIQTQRLSILARITLKNTRICFAYQRNVACDMKENIFLNKLCSKPSHKREREGIWNDFSSFSESTSINKDLHKWKGVVCFVCSEKFFIENKISLPHKSHAFKLKIIQNEPANRNKCLLKAYRNFSLSIRKLSS